MTRPRPLVSVITVVRNAEGDIARTIETVIACKNEDVEYIVFDGASTDGTFDVISGYAGIDLAVSERDSGIYDAMNRAAALASGEFILNINAGDRLLHIPAEGLRSVPSEVDLVACPVTVNGARIFRPSADWRMALANMVHHQGAFYRRAAVRPYDTQYRVFADYDLNLELHGRRRIAMLNTSPVADHTADGVSNHRSSAKELFAVVRNNRGRAAVAASFVYLKMRGLAWRIRRST